jgi:hypothetical protein
VRLFFASIKRFGCPLRFYVLLSNQKHFRTKCEDGRVRMLYVEIFYFLSHEICYRYIILADVEHNLLLFMCFVQFKIIICFVSNIIMVAGTVCDFHW